MPHTARGMPHTARGMPASYSPGYTGLLNTGVCQPLQHRGMPAFSTPEYARYSTPGMPATPHPGAVPAPHRPGAVPAPLCLIT